MTQFAFLQIEWPAVHDAAVRAEAAVHADPRSACFYARRALELAVAWAYKHDAALKLPDLDSGQRETLQSLKDSYARESAPLNDAWATAIEQDEQDPNNMSFGGDSMSIKFSTGPGGDDQDTPLAKARKARREFDTKTKERMNSVLTPAQREKLPKAATPGAGGEGEGEDEDVVVARPGGIIISR